MLSHTLQNGTGWDPHAWLIGLPCCFFHCGADEPREAPCHGRSGCRGERAQAFEGAIHSLASEAGLCSMWTRLSSPRCAPPHLFHYFTLSRVPFPSLQAPHNPFGAPTLGIIPGTSNTGYMLWLPTESELPWSPEGPQQQQQRPWSPAEGQPQPPQQHSHLHFYPQPPQQHGRALRGGGKAKADSSAAVDQLQEGGEAAASAQQPSPPRGKDDKGKAPLFPSHHPASS